MGFGSEFFRVFKFLLDASVVATNFKIMSYVGEKAETQRSKFIAH